MYKCSMITCVYIATFCYYLGVFPLMKQRDSLVLHGLAVSAFLAEAGWLPDAEIILTSCQSLLADSTDPVQKTRALECCHRWSQGREPPKGSTKWASCIIYVCIYIPVIHRKRVFQVNIACTFQTVACSEWLLSVWGGRAHLQSGNGVSEAATGDGCLSQPGLPLLRVLNTLHATFQLCRGWQVPWSLLLLGSVMHSSLILPKVLII